MGRRSLLSVALTASLTVAGAGTALAAPAALPAGCAQAGQTVTCTYAPTGAEQTFTVPAGITAVRVTAIGAAGGGSFGSSGGQGGSATGTPTGLTSGSTLYVEVGGVGGGPGGGPGFNGGGFGPNGAGSGGGASDVRTTARAAQDSLGSRLVVAGGGGGGGVSGSGNGGAAGAPGAPERGPQRGGGGAGTAQQGGAGGPGFTDEAAEPGRLGQGGAGYTSGTVGGGGGGGGGLYGGGGGGLAGSGDTGGGGGGGSSLVPSGGTTGLSSAPASVTISYTVPAVSAVTVRGGGTLSAGGQNYSIAVDAKATAAGQASGRFALSGGGADTTASSRTITAVRKTATGSTVTGTAVTASGRQVPFTLTVVDRAGGRDQVTVQIGGRTVSGTLTNGDIATS